ncbi:retention module-containing protein [Oxalobacter vibrioformis]|uniref:Retention module-containing protein n=1 Tax=Oxalobacter vibrioformis TaxID=933080 RepID=A0A9E9LY35_9BURK|nr:retention module-containing protein [Oxalobacter vibrioformis]WAW09577.1 retention module-containing protein [Oxalobacter vibrioformis]
MATPSMQSGRVVGTVKGVDGVVTAINERGVIRTLKPGDKVYAGETIQTADGANAHIDFSRGGFATLGAGQSLPMDGVVLSQAAEASKPQAGQTQAPGATDGDIEKLQQQIEEAIAKGEDPTALMEAAAAGPGAGGTGGAEEGGSFVVVEQLAARGNVTPGFDTGTFGYEFRSPEEYDGRETPGGDFDFEIRTELGDGTFVGYVFEDGQPYRNQADSQNAERGDRSLHAGQILFNFEGRGTTVVDKVHLSGFEPGTKLYIGDPAQGGMEVAADANGVFHFDQSDFNGAGVYLVPPLDSDVDMMINVVVDISVNGGGTGQLTGSFPIVVDAVADRPEDVKGDADNSMITGHIVIDGAGATEKLADGWAKTDIEKKGTNVTDANVKATANVSISATFFDVDPTHTDTSQAHSLYIEVPADGKGELGYMDNGSFKAFDTIEIGGKTYYVIPPDQVTWGDYGAVEGGSASAQVDCVYQATGDSADLGKDINLDLNIMAKAEETPTDQDPNTDNNVSWNESNAAGDVKITVDSVDSTLTIKAGWASEDNDDSKHKTGSYDPDYAQVKGDVDENGERGNAGVDADSTKDADGAPISLEISGSNNQGVTENITEVKFTFPAGELLSDGSVVTNGQTFPVGGNTYLVEISGNDVTITLQSGSDPWTSLDDLNLTFKPGAVQSDADLSFSYEVTVESSAGAEAVYTGSSTIVVDAVADMATNVSAGADYNGGSAAAAGETIAIVAGVTFNDLGAGEHKYVVLNISKALENGWTVDSGVDVLSKNEINAIFKSEGGANLPVDNVLSPTSGDADAGEYILLEVVSDGHGGWQVVDVNGDPVPGAKVTENNGHFEVEMPITAPATGGDVADSTVWVKPVTVVDQDSLGGEEYDYGNNISVGNAPNIGLSVSGVHSGISIGTSAVYEGNQPDKNMGNNATAPGGKITLTLVEEGGVSNTNPDALKAIVFQYDDTHGKVSLNGVDMPSGCGILFTYHTDTSGKVIYTQAQIVDAAGNVLGTVNVPGQSLGDITGSLKYTPTTGDVSDVDVDIDYVAQIVDPDSGASKIISSDGGNTWDDLKGSNHTADQMADYETNNQGKTTHDNGGNTATVVVDAVADKPGVGGNNAVDYGKNENNVDNTAAGNGDKVKITTTEVTFKDYEDNSENHYLLIGNKGVTLGDGTTGYATLPDQTIKLTNGNGQEMLIKIVDGEIVEIDGAAVSPTIPVNIGAITDANATGVAGNEFIKIPVPNDFLEDGNGKVTAEVELQLPEGIEKDQNLQIKVGGMAEETETNIPDNEVRDDNNTSYTFKDGTITVNVSNDITSHKTAGYEDGWSNQNTVDHSGDPHGPNNAVITISSNTSDHIHGTKTGETRDKPIIMEFEFKGGDGKLGAFTYNGHTYELGDGYLEKTGDGSYKLTIPADHLPAQTGNGVDQAKITYKPVANDDTDLTNVKVTMDTHADTSTDSATQTVDVGTVVIDAVADLPVSNVKDTASYHGNDAAKIGSEFTITVKDVQFQDYKDGSESHFLLIQKSGIKGTYDGGGNTPNVSLDTLGDQTITVKGAGRINQTITIVNGEMTITVDGISGAFTVDNLPNGWTVADWNAAQSALVNGTGSKVPSGGDYFKIPVLNEFLDKVGGKVVDAEVEVKLPDGTTLDKDADLTIKTGAMADDKATDSEANTGNNQAYQTDDTKVEVGVVTSDPGVKIVGGVISENLTPNANTGNFTPDTDGGAKIIVSGVHDGETATVKLTFDLMNGEDIPKSVNPGDQMRVEYDGKSYVATQNPDGTWSVEIPVKGLADGGEQTLVFKPGYNFNSDDIDVKYDITVKDNDSGAEKTWQNSNDQGTGYQDNDLGIIVDAVAQQPDVADVAIKDLAANGFVEYGQDVVVKAHITFQDATDGSELHYVMVEANLLGIKPEFVTIWDENGNRITIPITDDMYQQYGGKSWFKVPVPGDYVVDKDGDGKAELDVEVTFKTDGSSQNGTIHIGGMAVEDSNVFDNETNQETNIKNNIGFDQGTAVDVKFSQIGGVGISGKPLYENDMPKTHLGDDQSPTGYDQTRAGGAQISLSENGNADITKAEFTFDSKEGTLMFDGEPVIVWDNGKPVVNPALDVDGMEVKVDANGKVTVTFENTDTNPGLTDQLLGGNSDLTYVPNHNYSDKDVNLDYKVDYVNPDTGAPGSTGDQKLPLVVDAVAQKPADVDNDVDHIDVTGSDAATPNQKTVEAEMMVTVDFGNPFDADKSEGHYVLVEVIANMTVKGADIYMLNGKEYWRVPVDVDDIGADGKCTVTVEVEFVGDHDLLHALSGSNAYDSGMEVGALALEQDDNGQIFTGEAGNKELDINNNAAYTSGGEVDIEYNWTHGGTHYDLHVEPVYENDTPNAHLAYRPAESLRDADGNYYKDADGYLTDKDGNKVNPDGSPYIGNDGWLIARDGSLVDDAGYLVDMNGDRILADASDPNSGYPAEAGGGAITIGGIGNHGIEGSFTFTLEEGEGYIKLSDGTLLEIGNGTTVTITKEQYDEGVSFVPGVNFDDTDVKLKVEGFKSNDGSGTSIDSDTTQVIVDAVAQKPMDMDSSVSYKEAGANPGDPEPSAMGSKDGHGNEGSVKVVLSGEFADSDGSEKHYGLMEVTGQYTPDGSYPIVQGPDGKYYYQVELKDEDGDGKWTAEVTVKVNEDAMSGEYSEISIGTGLLSREDNTGGADNWELNTDNNLAWTIDGSVDVVYSTVGATVTGSVNNTYEGDEQGVGGEISLGVALGQHDELTGFEVSYDNTNGDVVSGNAGIDLTDYLSESGSTTTIDILSLLKDKGIDLDDSTAIQDFLDDLGLRFVADGHGSEDGSVSWNVVVKDQLSGDEKTYTGSDKVIIDAVANAPAVSGVEYESEYGKPAAKGGEEATVKVTLDFADNDGSEIHYAVLEQSTNITCKTVTIGGQEYAVETIVGADGTLYYGVKIPASAGNPVDVIFNVEAKDTGKDVADTLKVGGISAETNTGQGADKELTLDNNWKENVNQTVDVKIGAVETDGAKLKDTHLVESTGTAVDLELTATDGGSLKAVLEGNHEQIVEVKHTITQGGHAAGDVGTTVGQLIYDGKVYDLKITSVDGKGVATVSIYDGVNPVDSIKFPNGFDFDKDYQIKLDPNYHNNNDLNINTTVKVEDQSGASKDLTLDGSKVTIAATADAATGVAGADAGDAKAIDGHKTQVTVDLDADFADVDGSENHYFYVKVADGVEVVGGTLVIDSGKLIAAGFQPGDKVYMVDVGDKSAHVDKSITLNVPGDGTTSTDITVVGVSEERSGYGDGGTQYAYSDPADVTVDVIANPNIDGVVHGNKAPADILDTVRGHTDISGKTLLPNGYVTDADGDAIKIASVKAPSGLAADVTGNATDGWTVKGTYGEWTVKADGSYTYELYDQYKNTAPPTTGEETLTITVTDGKGWTSAELESKLTLGPEPNQAPVANDAVIDKEIARIIEGSFSFNDANRDLVSLASVVGVAAGSWNHDNSIYTVEGIYGTLLVKGTPDQNGTITTYEYEYHVNEAGLAAGVTDSFTFNGADDFGGNTQNGHLDITLSAIDYELGSGTYHDGSGEFGWNAGANIHGDMDSGQIIAGTGHDKIVVDGDSNEIHAGAGDDSITVEGDHNQIYGDAGDDTIHVKGDENRVYGGAGDDIINISGSDNIVFGGAGDDTINLLAGHGQTTVSYAKGDLADVTQGDTISGFKVSDDGTGDILDVKDLLSEAGLGNNSASLLDGGYLKFDSITQDANGKTTVTLSIDVDGSSGTGDAVHLATIVMDGVGALSGDLSSQAQNLFDQLIQNDQIKF